VSAHGSTQTARGAEVSFAIVSTASITQPAVRPTLELSCETPLWTGFVSFSSLLDRSLFDPTGSA
jgi:hypothetical protein